MLNQLIRKNYIERTKALVERSSDTGVYDKAGRINTVEQEQIVNNERGNAFIITGPTSRANIEIVASPKIRAIFHE